MQIARISASLIVKNEESCLETCLKSLKGVDEIVICDTGSTDSTLEIAKRFTQRVYSGEEYLWRDDFAFSRNQSLSKCTGDWILIIDADEYLEPGGLEKLRRIIKRTKYDCVFFETICEADHTDIHKSIRAFRKSAGIFWKGRVHNYLTEVDGELSDIKLYYGCSEAHKLDPDRALRILTKVVEEESECKRERFYLAREYWYRQDYETAIKLYKNYLTKAVWGPEISEAWLMLAKCHWRLKNWDESRACALEAIAVNTQFKEAFIFMANMSGPKNSKRWLEMASTATNDDVLFIRTGGNIT